jgi:hypothetical protein
MLLLENGKCFCINSSFSESPLAKSIVLKLSFFSISKWLQMICKNFSRDGTVTYAWSVEVLKGSYIGIWQGVASDSVKYC